MTAHRCCVFARHSFVTIAVAMAAVACGGTGEIVPDGNVGDVEVASLPGPLDRVARQEARLDRSTSIDAQRRSAIVDAANRVAPSVVSVNVIRRQRQIQRSLFDFFMPRGSERLVQGIGSGFIVSPDGVVITNQHVTESAEEIIVTMRDGRDMPAVLLGEDPLTDIAVLKIDATGLPVAPLGTSELVPGEWVVAIGNPYAYLLGNSEPTVTAGVVSAVGRNILPSQNQPGVYVGMIQTDAAINPGNSGGPLVNALGEVVGVNSSIFSNSGGSVGIGFAIPIERAFRVAQELQQFGAVRRAWFGVDVPGEEALRAWKQSGGLEVTSVADDSPASRAGLQAGDVLLSADGRPVRTFLDWEAVGLDVGPGDSVRIAYRRDGRDREVALVVADLPTATAEKVAVLGDVQVVTVTPQIRQERGVQVESGALIFRVGDRTRSATRLQPGDVIFQINRRRITSADDLDDALRRAVGNEAVLVYFERGGSIGRTTFYVR